MACPGVDKDKAYLIGAGKPTLTLPAGVAPEDVTFSSEYDDEDESMRMVREVNEDPPGALKVTVRKTLPVVLDRIAVSFKLEFE